MSDTADQWHDWFKTFSNFIDVIDPEGAIRLHVLLSFVSGDLKHVKGSTFYETAMETLRKLYVKPKNEVIGRHLFSNCKQDPNESLDQYHENRRLLT